MVVVGGVGGDSVYVCMDVCMYGCMHGWMDRSMSV